MQKVVALKREGDKNTYYFLENLELHVGDKVVAVVDEFQTVWTVEKTGLMFDEDKARDLTKIMRKATDSDLSKFLDLKKKAKKELVLIKKKSLELGLVMKFVNAEYSLDNSKIIITFSSEERVDFRQFLKELASMLKTRIELKQIGQRDEVKIVGGVGPCGEPCCCARFLKEFDHVTVKMAKIQGLSLAPTKINGICGRLMCCLGYEAGDYEAVISKMPKVGSEVTSPNGKGTVVYNDIMRERVSVKRQAEGDTFVVEDFDLADIVWGDKPQASVQKKENNQTKRDAFKSKDKTVENQQEKTEPKENKAEQTNNQSRDFKKSYNNKKQKFNPKHKK